MSISYYNANARSYFDGTVSADVTPIRERFLTHVKPGGSILDAGCASGRDAKAFSEAGYDVTAFDASIEMVRLAAEFSGLRVELRSFDEMVWTDAFDGIWASASLLHVARPALPEIFAKFANALRSEGAWYLSMKQGEKTRDIGGRSFTDVTELEIRNLLENSSLAVMDLWLSDDVRLGRTDRWLNVIAKAAPMAAS